MLIQQRKLSGFTLIELIVVIILVSIVSVVAATRLLNRSGFSVIAAQEQAIAITQQIQLGRMQSNISEIGKLNSRYQLAIKEGCFGSLYSCNLAASEGQSDYLELDNVEVSAPVSLLNFDLLGRPLCSSCTYPITIQFRQHNESAAICINTEGFVDAC